MRKRGDAADGTIYNQTGRTVRGHHDTQFADGSVAVATLELLITAMDRTDPPFPEFGRRQVVHQIGMIKGRLLGRVAVLQRNDMLLNRVGRKKHLARRNRRTYAEGDTLTQQAEEVHVWATSATSSGGKVDRHPPGEAYSNRLTTCGDKGGSLLGETKWDRMPDSKPGVSTQGTEEIGLLRHAPKGRAAGPSAILDARGINRADK